MHFGVLLTAVALSLLAVAGCRSSQDGPADLQLRSQPDLDDLPVLFEREIHGPGYSYRTEVLEGSGHRTVLIIPGDTNDTEFERAQLSITCDSRVQPSAALVHLIAFGQDEESANTSRAEPSLANQAKVLARFDPQDDPLWHQFGFEVIAGGLLFLDATSFLKAAKEYPKVWIRIPASGRIIEARFIVHAALRTEIQPNLDFCGAY